jgi:DNA-binding protein WhiA
MSFSLEVKEELVKLESQARHCQIAELAGLLVYSQSVKSINGVNCIEFTSDTPLVIKRCKELYDKIFNDGKVENIEEKTLQMIKYNTGDSTVSPLVIKSICCKRAYLRGAFISVGSMSNPQKGYHLEFVCASLEQANQLVDTLLIFDIKAKIVQRKKYQVVYIKESEEIVELLNVIGAHISLMNLENLRILKDMRNSINRRVNCEAANITKTVNAATKQIDDIEYIKEHYGFENLTENLREMAILRLELPEATLSELGQNLNIGKSGVNHRLRKLSELADSLRGGSYE